MRDRIGAALIAAGKKIRRTQPGVVVHINANAEDFIRGMRRSRGEGGVA